MDRTLLVGTDGTPKLSPFWGTFKADWGASIRVLLEQHRARVLGVYSTFLALSAAGLIGSLIALNVGSGSPYVIAVLSALAVYAESQTVRISPAIELSVGPILVVFAAALFGPLAAVIVGGIGLLASLLRRDGEQPMLRWLVWTSSQVLIAGGAGAAAIALGGARPDTFGHLLVIVAAASVAETIGDVLLSPIPGVIRGKGSWWEIARTFAPVQLSALPVHLPLISALVYVYMRVSPWAVALFVIPAMVAQRLYSLYRQQRQTAEELSLANDQLTKANLSFATALVATLDARDRYTAGHSAAVAIYARDIAQRMALSELEQARAHLCGLVHDIGKVGLPAGLLEKPGPLSLEERRQMQQHSAIGEHILAKVEDYQEVSRIVRHHHERFDGHGYPDALVGEEIPLLSRIIAVADAYNAMTSDRPYRDAMPSRVARLRLANAADSQFDTAVVASFEAILAGAGESYRMGVREDFTFEAQDDDVLSDVA